MRIFLADFTWQQSVVVTLFGSTELVRVDRDKRLSSFLEEVRGLGRGVGQRR